MANKKVSVKNLKKNFGSLEVLKDISLEINEGEVICLIGPSGSGKSTFLRCLNRLEDITSGSVVIDGEDITDPKLDINKKRENIGMVFQHFNLFPHMTVKENIMLAPVELKKMTKEEAEEELKTVYSSKGRKLDAAFALMMMGTYHLLTTHSNIKPKSNIIRLTLDFLELLDLASENDDENNLNAKIACLEKRNYTPKWDMKPQDIYRTSPNNHTNETINFRLW